MENPFETGHIKNYVLLYASIVVIMVLFFIASSLFHDVQIIEKKVFETESNNTIVVREIGKEEPNNKKFILMDKAY